MSSYTTHTTYSYPRSDSLGKNPGPPVPPRKDVPPRAQHGGTAMSNDQHVALRFRQINAERSKGHDIINEINKKRIADPAAIAAAVALAQSQVDQGQMNIDSSQVEQEDLVQPRQEFPPTQRRQQAESGGVSSGWGPLSLFTSIMPVSKAEKATARKPVAASGGFSISRGDIHDIKQMNTHSETAEGYLRCKYVAENLHAEVKQLQEEIERQKSTNESLQIQLEGQDSTVRKAQESAFAVVASSGPKAEDDDVIRSRLKNATSRWKQFAKKWASRSLADLREHNLELLKPFFEDLVHDKILAEDEVDSPDGIFESEHDSIAPGILLNAELARFVVNRLLDQPFTAAFRFGALPEPDAGSTTGSAMQTLHSIYHYIMQDDPATAHAWRSQTVSSLDPPEYQLRSTNTKRKEDARRAKQMYYRELITQFESSRAKALYRECNEQDELDRRTQLLDIFRECGDVFSALWAQKVAVSSLARERLLKRYFDVKSREFEAHAFHKLEEGEPDLDGKPIQLIVEPAIVAWGNEYGRGYDQYKVWTKAVVWVSSPAAEGARTQ